MTTTWNGAVVRTLARDEFVPTYFHSFSGVATHANFRSDKWHVGPAFDWDRRQK